MLSTDGTAARTSSLSEIFSWALGCLLASALAIAPIVGSIIAYQIFHFIPANLSALGLPAGSGPTSEITVGICATFFSWGLEMVLFLFPWFFLRRWKKGATLSVILLSCVIVSFYLAVWSLLGLFFPKRPDLSALIRIAILLPLAIIFLLRLRRRPASTIPLFTPTVLLAAGCGVLLLLPWMVLGALGSRMQTLLALAQASSFGIGEEILLRGILPLILLRATGRVRLSWLISFFIGVAMQPGYFLPLGDWISLFRLFNALAIGLLAMELAARGAVLPAILAHSAFEFGAPGFVDSRLQFSFPHPAALESLGIACALALAFWVWRYVSRSSTKLDRIKVRWIGSSVFASLALMASLGAWFLYGNPGFTEDGFLIIFKQQANLDSAYKMENRTEQIAFVYHALVSVADEAQTPIRQELTRQNIRFRSHYLMNMIQVDNRPDLASQFENRPEVARVIVNPNVRIVRYTESLRMIVPLLPTKLAKSIEWNIEAVGAPKIWDAGITGKGIVVASADTGVDWTHPAIQSQYRGWNAGAVSHSYQWLDAWDDTAAPWDDNGHGTHTVGIMVGDDGQGNQIGMAPGAQWIACRNMRYGIGNPGAYITCMEFFLAPYPFKGDPFRDGHPELAPDIVNNSWGCPEREGCSPDTLSIAFQNLQAAGIMMVAAAGNDGPACHSVKDPPGNDSSVFTVGAVNQSGELASFSSKGPVAQRIKPDVVAPGQGIRSSIPGGGYAPLDGTSMASPHVAGLIALLWAANPSLIGNISQTENILISTAASRNADGNSCPLEAKKCFCGNDSLHQQPNNEYGTGLVDAWKAYLQALLVR
jgi:hypothetical protein